MKKFLLCCLFAFAFTAQAAKTPNIVFIFADDWGWGDLGCHGHPYLKTPNIDRLAKEGTDFHRFTVASGVCSPSRTAVMTGHFPADVVSSRIEEFGVAEVLMKPVMITDLLNAVRRVVGPDQPG